MVQLVLALMVACLIVPCSSLINYDVKVICDEFEEIKSIELKDAVISLIVNNSQIRMKCETPIFSEFPKLTTLSVRKSNFVSINKHCFDGLDQLRRLFLSQSTIKEVDFGSLNNSKVQFIFLDRSNITKVELKGSQMPELEQLDMSSNLLSNFTLTSEIMPKIKRIDLSQNKVTKFLIESESIDALILKNNLIERFEADDLKTPQLLVLELSFNRLLTLTPEMLNNAPKIEHLYLTGTLVKKLMLSR